MRKEARILLSARDTPFFALPKALDTAAAIASLNEAFDDFMSSAGIEVLDCSSVTAGRILDAYFSLKPPFNSGEKRKEFPDAISLEAISERFKSEGIYVISGDCDVRAACGGRPGLTSLETLDAFLELELADHEDVTWISEALDASEEEIKGAISRAFTDGYFYLDDQEGEVDSVEVSNVEIINVNLISATDVEGEAAVVCRIRFEAQISYDDPGSTVYDEGEKYVFDTIEDRVEREDSGTFSVTFDLDRIEKKISNVDCNDTKSRSFSVFEDYDVK